MRLLFTAIGLVLLIAIMVRSSMDSAIKPKASHSIYIKIFMNYVQLVILSERFELEWPEEILEMREAHESVGSASDHVISFDCYFGGAGKDAGVDIYFDKLILAAVLPLALMLICFIIWGIVAVIKQNTSYLKREGITTLVILYFLIHPNLIQTFFFSLSCEEIEPGEQWLIKNHDIRCWEGEHLFYIFTVIIPSIVLWGCGLPIIFLLMIYKHRRRLNKYSVKARYGFLYNGYEITTYFWEFVILYRKILIVTILVFVVQRSTRIAALCCLIVLITSLHFQYKIEPFNRKEYNDMELRSIMVATVTLYCGLFYLTKNLSVGEKYTILALMLAVNLYFLIWWLYKMFGAGVILLRNELPCLRKYLGHKHQDCYGDELLVS